MITQSQKKVLMNTHHWYCWTKDLVDEFCGEKMEFFWVFLRTIFAVLVKFIARYFFRVENCDVLREEYVPAAKNVERAKSDEVVEEVPRFSFKFQLQSSADIIKSGAAEESDVDDSPGNAVMTTSTSKYQFVSGSRDFSYFVEEPEVMSFSIEESYIDVNKQYNESNEDINEGKLVHKDYLGLQFCKDELDNFESDSSSEDDVPNRGEVLQDKQISSDTESESVTVSYGDKFYENRSISSTITGLDEGKEELTTSQNYYWLAQNKSWLTRSAIYRETTDFDEETDENHFQSSTKLETEALADGEHSDNKAVEYYEEVQESLGCSVSLIDGSQGFEPEISLESDDGRNESAVDTQNSGKLEDIYNSSTEYSSNLNVKSWLTQNAVFHEPTEFEEDSDVPQFQSSSQLEIEVLTEGKVAEGRVEDNEEGPDEVKLKQPEALINLKHDPLTSDKSWVTRKAIVEEIANVDEGNEAPWSQSSLEANISSNIELANSKTEIKVDKSCEEGVDRPDVSDISTDSILQSVSVWDDEDSELESQWEHQDLIEQLKLELKKVRATGLPTILEEFESPKMSGDFKPWKIEEKFLHEDQMGELHKFYKIYRERMRKFDILNYQKMYTIGVLQIKDPIQLAKTQKSSNLKLAKVLSRNLGLSKKPTPEAFSSAVFIKELESDLEMVYVGQVCLSWEFLHWQFGKALQLLDTDLYETRQYNQIAGEFQQFQVLMQRFMENESFQGPRVQTYIKNRCVLRNLLQVPVIKEDSKDKEGLRRRKDAITCSMLLKIIEESMQIFWEFIRTDRDSGNAILKGLLGTQVELLDPADSDLLLDVQTILQKKDKRLKDILRSGNCIVRRFQKHAEEKKSDQLMFFSQVDLKLVWRVLRMRRIAKEQLLWCQSKLSKINFIDRKINVEPSFLPFPC